MSHNAFNIVFIIFSTLIALATTLRCMHFFFQAEDGIRDLTVTGVQTCALPIWLPQWQPQRTPASMSAPTLAGVVGGVPERPAGRSGCPIHERPGDRPPAPRIRDRKSVV